MPASIIISSAFYALLALLFAGLSYFTDLSLKVGWLAGVFAALVALGLVARIPMARKAASVGVFIGYLWCVVILVAGYSPFLANGFGPAQVAQFPGYVTWLVVLCMVGILTAVYGNLWTGPSNRYFGDKV
ncbi:MAG: hypothetical protein ABIP97_09230 [Chthoniobacterales bacterium]